MGSRLCYFIAVALLSLGCDLAYGAEFLTEKPEYLQSCERKSANISECLAKSMQNMFTTWKDGVPGTAYQGSIDPLRVEKYELGDDLKNVAPIELKITNYTVDGLKTTKVNNVSTSEKNYNFKLFGRTPKMLIDGNYSVKGKLLQLNLDAKGLMHFEIFNVNFSIACKVSLQKRENVEFFNLKAIKYKIIDIENVKMRFENLFPDQQLNNDTNELFNAFWRDLFAIFQPVIEKEINKQMFGHYHGIFNSVPAKYFIADVEKSE